MRMSGVTPTAQIQSETRSIASIIMKDSEYMTNFSTNVYKRAQTDITDNSSVCETVQFIDDSGKLDINKESDLLFDLSYLDSHN
jgi:hypothetical protein